MNFIIKIFAVPVTYIFKGLNSVFGNNFALLMFLLTLVVNLLMFPLSVKSQRSTAKQQMLKPKLDALKKKYGDNMSQQDKLKYQQEMQELYQKENVSMAGGCLPMLIRLPFLFAVYGVIQQPLTYIVGLSADKIRAFAKVLKLGDKATELEIFRGLTEKIAGSDIWSKIQNWDFNFFGIDLTLKPDFTLNVSQITSGAVDIKLWIIPLLAFGAQMLTSIAQMSMQKKLNPDQPSMKGMMLSMPLISLFLGFSVPAAVGLYWAFSSLVAGGIQLAVQAIYSPQKLMAESQAKLILERNREENERKSSK